MLLNTILVVGLLVVFVNVHVGYKLYKKRGHWKFGVVNWGIALCLALTIIDQFSKM